MARTRPRILAILVLVATAAAFLQIGGASWDVTSHILLKPETFFTPSHAILYFGAVLSGVAAIGGRLFVSRFRSWNSPFNTVFKILIIGSAIEMVAGPSDFAWHNAFGVDGLLSPPHLLLAIGILTNSIAPPIGLWRLSNHVPSFRKIAKVALVPAFASLWFSSIWFAYMFSLPISNGIHFHFNPNPDLAVVVAATVIPAMSAIVFVAARRTIGKLGAISTGIVLVGMNIFANILPSQLLTPFLPYYMTVAVPMVVAGVLPTTSRNGRLELLAGAIIGSIYYILCYPLLPMTFANILGSPNASVADRLPSFLATLPSVLTATLAPAAAMGAIGSIIILRIARERQPEAKSIDEGSIGSRVKS
jgi:hypothetical protein